jgi:cell wall-associated NlpC family hydrolase
VRQRGQITIAVIGGLTAVLLGTVVLLHLSRIAAGGAGAQTAADMAALAAARTLAGDPASAPSAVRAAAASAAHANGARLVDLEIERVGAVATAVDVTASAEVDGSVPVAGRQHDDVVERARAGVTYTAALPSGAFRPVDLHGARGPLAAVAAAEAQVGWPYVWGGESRAEGGFDCSGLIDYAYTAAGLPLPGRPTAADLWHLAAPEPPGALVPGDLVFVGASSGAPHHVGMYVGAGAVVVAPHTGAAVRYEPLAAGGWDGYGRLAGPPPRGTPLDPAVERAAREHRVPAHVIAAELDLGVAADPDGAASSLAAAQRSHPGDLQAALADALGDASLAAAVLRRGSGPGLEAGGAVRLLPTSKPGPHVAPQSAMRVEPLPAQPAAGGGNRSWIGRRALEVITGAEHVAGHLEETGGEVSFQGAAGLKTIGRAGVMLLSSVLPRQWERDAAAAAGSAWDAGSALAGIADGGLPLGVFGLWAARITLLGTLLLAGSSFLAARRAATRDERVVALAQMTGYGLTAAGLATAGPSLVTAGVATAEIPPVGLALCAAGSAIIVASYAYRYRSALGRAVRAPVAAVEGVASAARNTARAALDAVNPF